MEEESVARQALQTRERGRPRPSQTPARPTDRPADHWLVLLTDRQARPSPAPLGSSEGEALPVLRPLVLLADLRLLLGRKVVLDVEPAVAGRRTGRVEVSASSSERRI